MKVRFGKEKYLRYSARVARKNLARRQKRKRISLHQRKSFQGKNEFEVRILKDYSRQDALVHAPKNCSFLSNTEEVVTFTNELEYRLSRHLTTFVNLKKVEDFDYGAIAILLSVMSLFRIRKINFNGNFPRNDKARKLIIDSGFFEHIRERLDENIEYSIGVNNQIVTHMDKNVAPELSIPLMEAVSKTIWGEKRVDGGMHSVLMELMQNTNNHAATGEVFGEKHWWLSVNHDPENKRVRFSFVDHGVGILTSLDRKPPGTKWHGLIEKAKSTLGIVTNDRFLQQVMEGKIHETVTGKTYRGKGLPNIKRMGDFGRICNLYVISNNVYADVTGESYRILNQDFQGTFFYWEMCESNFNKPWPTGI